MEQNGLVSKKYWLFIGVGLAALLVVVALGYGSWWGAPKMETLKTIQNFSLDRIDGQKVQFDDTKGKVKLVSFIFTRCPDVCPVTTDYMSQMQKELQAKGLFGSEVLFYSISFDTENDTPEVLENYAKKFNADLANWYFLRGDEASMKKATNEFWFGAEKQANGIYIHTMKTYLVDKQNNLRKMYGMGSELDMQQVVKDIEQLTKE